MSDITLGIIGSGQLGSLLCKAAKKLNIKTIVISDDEKGPAQNYTDQFMFAKYEDKEKVKEFINKVENAFKAIPYLVRFSSLLLFVFLSNRVERQFSWVYKVSYPLPAHK